MTSQTSPSVTRALVLFSGGQDSATCLAWALDRFDLVETIGFDYGQRHAVELTCREKVRIGMASLKEAWATRLGDDHMIDATVLKSLGETAMTHDVVIETTEAGLPSTFVPGRNLVFLTVASALAYRRGHGVLPNLGVERGIRAVHRLHGRAGGDGWFPRDAPKYQFTVF